MLRERFVRYLFSGGFTTLLMFVCVYVTTEVFRVQYLVATSVSFLVVLWAGYGIHKYWTFRNEALFEKNQFPYHGILNVMNFFLNGGLVYVTVGKMGFSPLIGQVCSSGVLALLSFIVYHTYIFPKKNR